VPSTVLAESGLSECHLSPDCVESFNQFFVDVAVGIVVISACSSWERSSRSRHRVAWRGRQKRSLSRPRGSCPSSDRRCTSCSGGVGAPGIPPLPHPMGEVRTGLG